jgi:hypothetical protein
MGAIKDGHPGEAMERDSEALWSAQTCLRYHSAVTTAHSKETSSRPENLVFIRTSTGLRNSLGVLIPRRTSPVALHGLRVQGPSPFLSLCLCVRQEPVN